MNPLNILPFAGNLGDTITNTVSSLLSKSNNNTDNININIKESDIRKGIETLSNAQSSLTKNNITFVSGAIPSMLWAMVVIIIFNFVIAPLLMGIFNIKIPYVELPEWYSSMCTTIVIGLFAKKAWDSTDISAGNFNKKSKYESENNTDIKNVAAKIAALSAKTGSIPTLKSEEPKSINILTNPEEIDDIAGDESTSETEIEKDINDPAYINKRINELAKKYNISK